MLRKGLVLLLAVMVVSCGNQQDSSKNSPEASIRKWVTAIEHLDYAAFQEVELHPESEQWFRSKHESKVYKLIRITDVSLTGKKSEAQTAESTFFIRVTDRSTGKPLERLMVQAKLVQETGSSEEQHVWKMSNRSMVRLPLEGM